MKKSLYILPIIILAAGILSFYWPFFSGSVATISGHQIEVKDVVTGNPIEGVTLGFTFADYCHSEDIIRGGYDYATCDGRYEPISPVVTNKNGIAEPDISLVTHPPAGAIRYYVEGSSGYHPTLSYGLAYHDTVWLVPLDAPLENKAAAVEFLKTQSSMQKIFDFYSTNSIAWEYLYAEEEAWYGAWRVTLNLTEEIGDRIIGDSLTVLVHPDASQYMICNVESGRHYEFLQSLPESYDYSYSNGECFSDLLFN